MDHRDPTLSILTSAQGKDKAGQLSVAFRAVYMWQERESFPIPLIVHSFTEQVIMYYFRVISCM
jgi:hypothetical protein